MKNKKMYFNIVLAFVLFSIGIIKIISAKIYSEEIGLYAYMAIGGGSSSIIIIIKNICIKNNFKKNPDLEREYKIKNSDERNLFIEYRAKAKAFDFMTHVFGVIIFFMITIEMSLMPLLILILAYIAVNVYVGNCLKKYNEEM